MLFWLLTSAGVDSRKRSASMERMPVVRFSSSGVSSWPRLRPPCDGQQRDGLAGEKDGVELHGHHDGLEGLAHVGGGGEAGGGLLFEAAEDDALKLDGEMRGDLADRGRLGELDGADGLELGRVGAVEGMAAGGELVEDEAEGEDVGLDAGLAGDELLRRHVGDGAAARGVGGAGRREGCACCPGRRGRTRPCRG